MADADLIAQARAWRDDDPDPVTRAEVDALLATGDVAALGDRFATRLEFGTAGLRGAVGAGPNRMNRALVRRATAGLAAWLVDGGHGGERVVVGRDARHGSAEFAADTAAVLAGAGLRPVVFEGVAPTPVVAFAVTAMGTAAGVMVTASHNPPADNGYKVYAGDGAQIVPPDGHRDLGPHRRGRVGRRPVDGSRRASRPSTRAIVAAYVAGAVGLSVAAEHRDVRIAYTPMHGVGRAVLLRVLEAAGFPAPAVVGRPGRARPRLPDGAVPEPGGARGHGPAAGSGGRARRRRRHRQRSRRRPPGRGRARPGAPAGGR